ncbi:hypothetical protein ACIRJM_23025 [Streptomyces sp. NPDC102405]|jgi:hypothetical protein|uniref:hypothetical protein n=1 Tax=Streptomyces sp. NPDC102405 TaxID=3366170 RepID=UPI00382BE3F9
MATATPTPIAPLPQLAVEAAGHLEASLVSPVDVQCARIGRLEESVWIQTEGLRKDLDTMRDLSLPDEVRAKAEGSFHSTLQEIAFLKSGIAEAEADLRAALDFEQAAVTCSLVSRWSGTIAPGEFDRLANLQDVMAGMHATLAGHNRLDLVGGA